MRVGSHVWTLGRYLLLLAALGVTFLVSFGVALRVALRAREVQVPSLVGRAIPDATQAAAELGLTLRIDPNRRPSERVPAGQVMQQEPQPGDLVRRQRSIRVWASTGPAVTTVPALSGQTERTARIRAAQANLSIAAITEIRSPDYESDIVIAHDPPAATQANGVALLLNRGGYPVAYVMPDVIGMNAAQAGGVLRERGFHVITVATASATTGLPSGTVVRQQPSGGFRVALTDPISLEATR